MSSSKAHQWNFFRAGGFDQVDLGSGADLAALAELDQKLWVALACPVKGLEIDSTTLALIDADGDGRIRVPEVLAAIEWATSVLNDLDGLRKGGDILPLSAIRGDTESGHRIRESAQQILTNLGKPDATSISLDDVSDTARIFAGNLFNGDGIVPLASAGDDEIARELIEDILATVGGEEDRVGTAGVDQAHLDSFFAEAEAWSSWWASTEGDATILPLGEATAAASTAAEAVTAKIEDYFTRCNLIAFDERAAHALNRADADWQALAGEALAPQHEQVAAFPMALVAAGRPLPLGEGVNPGWAAPVATFRDATVTPLLGDRDELSQDDWAALQAMLAPFQAWSATKAGAAVESLGLERVRHHLASDGRARVAALIARDLELKPEADAIDGVEKLVRFQRDFFKLLENFVNFRRFYVKTARATFQTGVLYLDNRSCDLVMRVDDPAKHAALAALSRCYLAYLDCTRRGGDNERRSIVAAFTNGDVDFLMVGRNGVFYDREGNDWDATITRIVDNPLSIRQAFWAPYKRLARLIEQQIEKFAAAREKASDAQMASGVSGVADKAAQPAPAGAAVPAPAGPGAFDIAKFAGIFAAVGLALGAIGSALALLITGFLGLVWWQMPLAITALMLLVSGPSMLLAALKLRQRNLAPLLEANGWAINARARINIPFGKSLTALPELPPGAKRTLDDPYAEKPSLWPRLLLLLTLLCGAVLLLWRQWPENG